MTDEKDAIPPSFRNGGAIDALAGSAAEDNLPGRELGDYRLVGLLAEGGMSRVYRAERIDGSFEREVAIKVSYISGFDEQSRQRFLAEQSILAGFSHPHISQLFDAGLTEEGWPYFVMELVSGQSIVDYCADRTLDFSERVKLLTKVVEAVRYAHGQLVLHRDIKPSNVLVSDDGVPKLLDFGIAKPLDASTAIATQGAMTPRYASPEQILGEPTGVASDIYQLGLLIFETLTGHSLNAEDDPLSLRRNLTAGTSIRLPAETRQQLPADCVAIIEQCLRLSADDRYPSVAALAEDLVAFLQGFPVRAVGQSVRYRAGKYAARNPGVVVFTVAVLLLLAGASTWYVYQVTEQRNIALQQQEMTEETLKFMASFFEASDPDKHQGEELTASEILIRGAERVERELGDRPAIQRRLFAEIATSFMGQERTNEKYAPKHALYSDSLHE